MSKDAPCCGYGLHKTKDGYVFQPHDMDCPALVAMAQQERDGMCSQCGVKLIIEQDGAVAYCPAGHMRRLTGEAALEVLDESGSSWIRDVIL